MSEEKRSQSEEVRRMLDERGIEHDKLDRDANHYTYWDVGGVRYKYTSYGDSRCGCLSICCANFLTPEKAIAATVGPKVTEDTSDGWHSFKDLYHHRALLFSVIVHNYKEMCWKSKRHDDGKELDWNFIVGIDTPWGQASYHYGMEYWDMFDCKVLDKAPHYDGYTPEQSVERIARLVELDAATVGRSCASCPEMDNPDSYIRHLHRALEVTDECAGTCHMRLVYEKDADGCIWHDHYECDACDAKVNGIMPFYDTEIQIPPKYCPNCGKRVIKED